MQSVAVLHSAVPCMVEEGMVVMRASLYREREREKENEMLEDKEHLREETSSA
jgi:hypothetical protein